MLTGQRLVATLGAVWNRNAARLAARNVFLFEDGDFESSLAQFLGGGKSNNASPTMTTRLCMLILAPTGGLGNLAWIVRGRSRHQCVKLRMFGDVACTAADDDDSLLRFAHNVPNRLWLIVVGEDCTFLPIHRQTGPPEDGPLVRCKSSDRGSHTRHSQCGRDHVPKYGVVHPSVLA